MHTARTQKTVFIQNDDSAQCTSHYYIKQIKNKIKGENKWEVF